MEAEPGTAVATREPAMVLISPETIQAITTNIQLAEQMVTRVLSPEVDYGQVVGIRGKILFDPGAAKIMAAFNCYARHRVLRYSTEGQMTCIIQAEIVDRNSQQVVAMGIGAASTTESKWKYRWVSDPVEYGFPMEIVPTLKTRERNHQMEYRIPNPEEGDLVHTLAAMAAKRAEVDAVRSLPGVG
ncbi:hypothetical protein LCGC14_3079420, partial [marine sediment metagenome]